MAGRLYFEAIGHAPDRCATLLSELGRAASCSTGGFLPGLSPRDAAAELIRDCLGTQLPGLDDLARRVEVPVCYAMELAPDLAEVARLCRFTVDEQDCP